MGRVVARGFLLRIIALVLIARDVEAKERCERLHCYSLHLAGVARSKADLAGRQYCWQAARSAQVGQADRSGKLAWLVKRQVGLLNGAL